jgi:plastocyanin
MKTLGSLIALTLTGASLAFVACGGGTNEAATDATPQSSFTAQPTRPAPTATSTIETGAAPTDTPQAAATPTVQRTQPAAQPTQPHPPAATSTPVPPPVQSQSLTIAANGSKFVPSKLNAAGGSAVTITFDNQDAGVAHDLIVYTPGGGIAGQAEIFTGPATRTFTFTPSGPGTYAFKCSVHPTSMYGTIAVAP